MEILLLPVRGVRLSKLQCFNYMTYGIRTTYISHIDFSEGKQAHVGMETFDVLCS